MIPVSTLREGVNVAKDNAGLVEGGPPIVLAPPSCDAATLDNVEPLVLYVDEVEEVACPPLSDLRRKFIWNDECTRFDSSKGASYP
jgi:hypothetical protein